MREIHKGMAIVPANRKRIYNAWDAADKAADASMSEIRAFIDLCESNPTADKQELKTRDEKFSEIQRRQNEALFEIYGNTKSYTDFLESGAKPQ